MIKTLLRAAVAASFACVAGSAVAGPVFLTGHDPDFHTQPGLGAGHDLLAVGLSYVTGGTYNDHNAATKKFLWVESTIAVPGGHVRGEGSLDEVGVNSSDYDRVDGAGFATVDLSQYSAIAIASTFGGTLTRAELQALVNRKADIQAFINNGGGLFASAECYPCGANLAGGADLLFAYLPVNVTSIGANAPFHVTPFGASLGLTDADMNDPTHNSFGEIGGLNVVDRDAQGNATTLAGIVRVNDGGFQQVPEPASLALVGLGLLAAGRAQRRQRRA